MAACAYGVDAVRPGPRSLPVHAASRGRRVTAPILPVRVMVEDVWNEVSIAVPASTPLGDLKSLALRQAGVPVDASEYLVKYLARNWRTRIAAWPTPVSCRTRPSSCCRAGDVPSADGQPRSRESVEDDPGDRALRAAILAFDGVAVIVLGVLAHRPLFTVMGAVMAAAACDALVLDPAPGPAGSDQARRRQPQGRTPLPGQLHPASLTRGLPGLHPSRLPGHDTGPDHPKPRRDCPLSSPCSAAIRPSTCVTPFPPPSSPSSACIRSPTSTR